VGQKLVQSTIAAKTGYPYDFHLLADNQVVNAFALPVSVLLQLLFYKAKNEDQLAGVLGHEIGHVIHRHGAERAPARALFRASFKV
jgi:predicted Zn-dependent protease